MSSGTTTTTTTTTKVRLVRCPKCRRVLQEMPNVPVYQCGGCSTILQAKSQRQTISSLPEARAEETRNLDHVSEEKASSSSYHETTLLCADECHSDRNSGTGQTESGDNNNIDNLRGQNIVSKHERNTSDQNGYKEGGEKLESSLLNDIQKNAGNTTETGVSDNEQVICANLSNEDHDRDSSTSNEDCSSKDPEFCDEGQLLRPMSVRTRFKVEGNGNKEFDSIYKKSNKGEIVNTAGSYSIVSAGSLAGESLSSDVLSPPNELFEQPQEPAHHGLDHLRSTDTFCSSNEELELPRETALHGLDRLRSANLFSASPNEQLQERTLHGHDRLGSTDTLYVSSNEQLEISPEIPRYGRATDAFVDPSSELSSVLINLSKSPMTRSSRAYYDDGVSSYEGTDDQWPNRHKHGYAVSGIRPSRRDRVPVNSNYGTQQHFRNSAAIPAERTHNPLTYNKLDRDELLDSAELGHPGRSWTDLERDEFMPHHAFHKRESLATVNQIPNELHDRAAYADQERLELLRMVSELQDQLNKVSMNDKTTGRVNWNDHQIPAYYNHEVEPEENFYNFDDPRYSGSNWPQQRKFLQLPFSAEVAISRHRERKWSAQLPGGLGYNMGLSKAHSRPDLHKTYSSCPSSSPQQHLGPQFDMYSQGSMSDDQMNRDNGVRRHFGLPKRHLRPLAGGAPFVTCPYCLKQLQLPADFLLFKKRCHRLKCGECSEVLKFSLVNNTHLIPYMPLAEVPAPSELDDRRRNFTSTSHVTDCPSVSCSDDCGQSFCKSCSQGNFLDRKMSDGLLEHEKERKIPYLDETRSKGKTPMDYESEEAERGGNSPLHRLMGYPSARQVIYG